MSEFQHICLKRVAWPRGVRKTWTPYWSRSCDLPPQISNGDSKTFAPHLSTSSQRVNSEICQSHLVIWGCELTSCRIADCTYAGLSQSEQYKPRESEREASIEESQRRRGDASVAEAYLQHRHVVDDDEHQSGDRRASYNCRNEAVAGQDVTVASPVVQAAPGIPWQSKFTACRE